MSYFAIFCFIFCTLSVWCELLCNSWKNIYEISLFGTLHIEIEFHFYRFCFPDKLHHYSLSQYACEIFNRSSCLRRYTRDRKKTSLLFVKRKQSSGINNARKHSTGDRERFEKPSPVIISSRLPLFDFCVLMGLSRNHRCGITDNLEYCSRIRTVTIITYSHKLLESFLQ